MHADIDYLILKDIVAETLTIMEEPASTVRAIDRCLAVNSTNLDDYVQEAGNYKVVVAWEYGGGSVIERPQNSLRYSREELILRAFVIVCIPKNFDVSRKIALRTYNLLRDHFQGYSIASVMSEATPLVPTPVAVPVKFNQMMYRGDNRGEITNKIGDKAGYMIMVEFTAEIKRDYNV